MGSMGTEGSRQFRRGGSFCEQECGAKVPELPRTGTEGEGDLAEAGQEREGSRQVDDDAAHRAQHACAELQQALPQGPDLIAGALGSGGPQAQFLQQDKGSRAEQHPELIGPEIGATGAVDLESLVQFLDPVFDVPALAIHSFVNPAGALGLIGDDESRVIFGVLAGIPNHFGFDDDAAVVRPRSSGVVVSV